MLIVLLVSGLAARFRNLNFKPNKLSTRLLRYTSNHALTKYYQKNMLRRNTLKQAIITQNQVSRMTELMRDLNENEFLRNIVQQSETEINREEKADEKTVKSL